MKQRILIDLDFKICHVNDFDWYESGGRQKIFEYLNIHVPLDLSSRVLDVGCGDGRVGSAFAREQKNFNGSYSGFDIVKP